MDAVRIVANFHVFVPAAEGDRRVAYQRGQTVKVADIPDDQSAQDWIEKGLAEALD